MLIVFVTVCIIIFLINLHLTSPNFGENSLKELQRQFHLEVPELGTSISAARSIKLSDRLVGRGSICSRSIFNRQPTIDNAFALSYNEFVMRPRIMLQHRGRYCFVRTLFNYSNIVLGDCR